MLIYYLRLGARHLRRYWVSSLLSIGGLTLALALCLIVMIRYMDLGRVGSEIPNGTRLFTTHTVAVQESGRSLRYSGMQGSVAKVVSTFPGVEALAMMSSYESATAIKGDESYEMRLMKGDKALADLMPHDMVAGSWAGAYSDPNQVILSYDMAVTLFGSPSDAMGKNFDIVEDGQRETKSVTGVTAPYRDYERYKPGAFIGLKPQAIEMRNAGRVFGETVILLEEGISPDQLFKDYDEQLQAANDGKQFAKLVIGTETLGTRPYTQVFARADSQNPSMKILAIAALMLLLVGVASHLSLASAIAAARGREIALRKVAGASKSQLVSQFLAESIVLVSVAFMLSVMLANDISAALSPIIGADLEVIAGYRWMEVLILVGIAAIVGLLGGVQPGITAFRSSVAGSLATLGRSTIGGGALLRRFFLLVQACLAGGMIFASIVMYQQVNHLLDADRGYDARGIYAIELPLGGVAKGGTLVNEIRSVPGVKQAGLSGIPPYGRGFGSFQMLTMQSGKPEAFGVVALSPEAMAMTGIELIAGRLPTRSDGSEAEGDGGQAVQQVMLAERDLGKFGIPADPQEAVGKCFYVKASPLPDAAATCYEVTGVMPNLRHSSMRGEEATFFPTLYYRANPKGGAFVRQVFVELDDSTRVETEMALRSAFETVYPAGLFKLARGEDQLSEITKQERALLVMIQLSALGTLIIALSGTYSLTRFDVMKQGREIALRRVLGAGDRSVIKTVVKKMLPFVVVGLALGLGLAWYAVGLWLEDYAARVDLSALQLGLVFAAGLALYLLSALTELVRAVRIRPADVLHAD